MTLQHTQRLAILIVLLLVAGVTARAQSSSEFWIRVSDNASATDTATRYYGNHLNGTYGIDSLNPTIKETEYPPAAFSFDARWINIPGRPSSAPNGLGSGVIPFDYRGVPANPTQKDTFQLAFQNSDQVPADFTFEWQDAASLALRCDSIFLVDPTRCALASPINMMTQTSVTLTAPQACDPVPVTRLRIYKYGVRTIDAVKDESRPIPSSFALHQNYPNPFNPSTTIEFDIQKKAFTDIAVFNMLGQRIATLVSEEFAPGRYATSWNGTASHGKDVSNGVYYVRMVAKTSGADGVEKFSSLRKLLLMK